MEKYSIDLPDPYLYDKDMLIYEGFHRGNTPTAIVLKLSVDVPDPTYIPTSYKDVLK